MLTKKVLATPKSRQTALICGGPIGDAHAVVDVPAEGEAAVGHGALLAPMLAVHLFELLGGPVPVEEPERALAARLPHAVRGAGSAQQVGMRRGQGAVASPRGTTEPRHAVFDDLGKPAGIARDHRNLAPHRLGGGNTEALLQRGDDGDRRGPVIVRQVGVGHPAEERGPLGDAAVPARPSSAGRSKPSPARTSWRSGKAGLSWAAASIRNRMPFRGKSWRQAKIIRGP